MAKPEKKASGALEQAGEDAGSMAKAGPAGVLPLAMIALGLLAIVALGLVLLFRG